MNEVMRDRLDQRFQAYVRHGWTHFQAREYREALDRFVLADSLDREQPDAKRGVVLSAIAASQFALAERASAAWIQCDPELLDWVADVSRVYGDQNDYAQHFGYFEAYAAANPSREGEALRAIVLWGRGDPTGARQAADRAADGQSPDSPYAVLAKKIRDASSRSRTP
ncbi:MAG: hypothetical protein JXA69_12600 [Phycisphaerae bacterium]|nr:hypothetical protein [Phycisphaerae bacterium]